MKQFFVLNVVLLLLLQSTAVSAEPVIRDGLEYLQPADFTNLSWNEVNAVCPAGVCVGTLNAFDLTGFTWAGRDAYLALTGSFGIPTPNADETHSSWLRRYFGEFETTFVSPEISARRGVAVLVSSPLDCYQGFTICVFIVGSNEDTDFHSFGASGLDDKYPGVGHLFFRAAPPAGIPILSTTGLLLLLMGFLMLAVSHFRK